MSRICLLAVLWLAASPALAAAPDSGQLGRLFLDAAQRQALVASRSAPGDGVIAVPELTPQVSAPRSLRVNGVVQRSGRPSLVWINQRPIESGDVVNDYRVRTDLSGVQLTDPSGRSLRLSVGQQLDLDSGRIVDSLPPGALDAGRR